MDKQTREWLSEIRALPSDKAEIVIRARVQQEGNWAAAFQAVKHANLPSATTFALADDAMSSIGRPFAHHQAYQILLERLGSSKFLMLLNKHIPADPSDRELLQYNLKIVIHNADDPQARIALEDFLLQHLQTGAS